MQISVASPMEKFGTAQLKYLDANLEDNNIGPKGCKYLTEANWKNMKYLHMGIEFII